jgi:hypothetical protein
VSRRDRRAPTALAVVALAALGLACPTPEYVPPPGPPRVLRFEVRPTAVVPGGTVTLAWRVEAADRLRLRVDGAEQAIEAEGERPLRVESETTVVLLAAGPGGASEARLSVGVLDTEPLRLERFEIEPEAVEPGDAVRVSWSIRAATAVALEALGTTDVWPELPPSGVLVFRPRRDARLRLRAEGPGGPLLAERAVRVRPPLPWFEEARLSPTRVETGARAQLEWRSANADRVDVRASGPDDRIHGEWSALPPAGRLEVEAGNAPLAVVLVASGPGGSSTVSLPLEVVETPGPEILTLVVTPTISGADGDVLVHLTARRATGLELAGPDGVRFLEPPGAARVRRLADLPARFEAVARDAAGRTATASAEVAVDPARPRFLSARAIPDRVPLGDELEIDYEVIGASGVRLEDGLGTELARTAATRGVLRWTPPHSQTLQLVAESPWGSSRRLLPIEVLR